MSINKLTKYAATRFAELGEAAEEAHSRLLTSQRRIKEIEHQRRLLGEDDAATFDALTREIERISQTRDRQQDEFKRRTRLVTSIRTWINGLPASIEFETIPGPTEVAFENGEATDSAIDRIRAQIEKLQRARASLSRAVAPIGDAYQAVSARVDELAKRGRPTLSVDRGKLAIKFPVDSAFSGGLAKDALAITAWLHPDELRDKLHAEVDALYEGFIKTSTPVMPLAERDRRLAALDKDILELERQEEQCITEAEGFNMFVPRREDANPMAILSLAVVTRAKTKAKAA